MAELYDSKGNMQIPAEAIIERLSARISQLTIEVATLQAANALLQQQFMDDLHAEKSEGI